MARLHIALLLLLIAISAVIVSAAAEKAPTTTATSPTGAAPIGGDIEGDPDAPDDAIGTTDNDTDATPGDDDVAVAGPVGTETSYANYPPPQQTAGSSGATTTTAAIGLVSVVVATVGSLFF
ncbi:unnamed protein product [Cochlearia groenlandica]